MAYFTLIYNPARNPPWLKEAEAGFEVIVKEIDTYQNNLSEVSEVAQSGPPLCDHLVYSLPGFSIHGILQARILEWVTISFSRASSQPRDRTQVSRIVGRCFNLTAGSLLLVVKFIVPA